MESLSVGLVTKLAVGDLNRSIGITGRTHVAVPGATPADFSGGLLALSSNSGVFNSNDWTIVPEFGVNLGWNIRRNLEMHLGYSFLFWSEVARASEQVDVRVNPNLIPPPMGAATPSLPSFTLRKSDIWVHSITLGLEYRF